MCQAKACLDAVEHHLATQCTISHSLAPKPTSVRRRSKMVANSSSEVATSTTMVAVTPMMTMMLHFSVMKTKMSRYLMLHHLSSRRKS